MSRFEEEINNILNSLSNERSENRWKTELKNTDRPIVLFGAGAAGHFFAEDLISWNIKLTCFCDNQKEGMDEKCGIPIISFEKLCRDYQDAYIFISVGDAAADSIKNQLISNGFSSDQFISRIYLEDKLSKEDFIANIPQYHKLIEKMEDERSKTVVYEKLRYFLEYFELQHSDPPNNQYFDDTIIQFDSDEVFVDGGAYDGDTLKEFIKRSNGNYKKIFSFEPAKEFYTKLSETASNYDNVELFDLGLWENETEMPFRGDNWSKSRIQKNGNEIIKCIAIDDFFKEYQNDIPTFIKLDVEGAEVQTLLGGRELIKKYKPKLAVAIYHNPDDIFLIPDLIQQLNREYKLYIRQYSKSHGEMICYAV